MPQISVIVPVYKVEPYINHCIGSILAQTYTDYELILVDDGSPDNCGMIGDEYALGDDCLITLHKNNAGVSAARNMGLRMAVGEYLAFADSDDYYKKEFLKCLITNAIEFDVDLVQSGFVRYDEDGNEIYKKIKQDGLWIIESEDDRILYLINKVLYQGIGWECWSALFKKEIVEKNCIRFCEKCGNFAEDLGFMLEYMLCANRVLSIKDCNYCYVSHESSMMAKSKKEIKLNSMNEVSIQFGQRYFQNIRSRKNHKRFAILYYLILWMQYWKLNLEYGKWEEAICEIRRINNINWHDKWMRKLIYHKKELVGIIGNHQASVAILNSRLGYQRKKMLSVIERKIAWKFFIK